MVWIMIDLPEELDHKIAIYKAENGLSSKDVALIMALSKYFKIKFNQAYKEDDEDDVKIR